MTTNERPAEEDVILHLDAKTVVEVYWCFAGPQRPTGHWYARVCRDGENTIGRKVESQKHGITWARGIAKSTWKSVFA